MTAKFKLDDHGIEISGTEEFVGAQLENFKDLIKSSYEKILEKPITGQSANENILVRRAVLEQDTHKKQLPEDVEYIEIRDVDAVNYDNVFVNEGGKIHIISDVPGSTTAAIMINVILIFMWAKMKQGIDSVPLSDLRDACVNYGHFDSSNFSRYMDQNKKYFLVLGEGRNRTMKLIRPGIKEAERLITELNKKNN